MRYLLLFILTACAAITEEEIILRDGKRSFDFDNSMDRFKKVIIRLKTYFKLVYHRKLPTTDTWNNYPFCLNVFCMN